ncbi:hypothetical protein GQ54DRAFT_313493 [Martensiomyces pterosporus]|nr:hypothetical protein GQ54DRAFT_313493 [Martensiomyces pterosporus]
MSIQRLPAAAVSRIRSASAITDVCDIVMELVNNSVDAGATSIRIEISLEQYAVAVKDNGCGISADSACKLGQRYSTSKYAPSMSSIGQQMHGYRGEALASISNVGLVDVTGRFAGSNKTYRCVFQNEKQLHRGESEGHVPSGINTAVKVRNIFATFPVRRKIIDSSSKKLADEIRTRLQIRSLGEPAIAFQLVRSLDDDLVTVFSYGSAPSLNQRISQIFGRPTAQALDFISFDYEGYSLRGSMSTKPIQNRIQHIFIDGYPYSPPELITAVRSVLSASDYMGKLNTTAGDPRTSAGAKAQNPMFVLMVATHGNSQLLPGDRWVERANFVVTEEMRRLVVLACIKFLKKFAMISSSQIQGAMSMVDSSLVRQKRSIMSSDMHGISGTNKRRSLASRWHMTAPSEGNSNSRRLATPGSRHSTFDLHESRSDPCINTHRMPIPYAGVQHGQGDEDCGFDGQLDFASMRVIGQADRKFIMCISGGWIVAIDQHAADERVQLEQYYCRLSKAMRQIANLPPTHSISRVEGVSLLVPPVSISLSRHECEMVVSLEGAFKQLGFQLVIRPPEGACPAMEEPMRALIAYAPTVLVPRLSGDGHRAEAFGKELALAIADWYTTHIRTQTASQQKPPGSHASSSEDAWSSGWPGLASAPPIILDTLKSMACRGAVKFNDVLSMSESQSIVDRLSECQFPGFCAHGRRSITRVARVDCV